MYNKLFTKILDSSIWLEDMPTRIVWLTLIAGMDQDGFCQFASMGNVAHRARVTPEEAESAIRCLESPDTESSDPDNEGRRIERVPGGWLVLNAEKHKAMITRAIAREQTKERVRRHREKRRCNVGVTPSETETDVQADVQSKVKTSRRAKEPPDPRVKAFLDWFQDEYKKRRAGAVYFVQWPKDTPTVKRLLTTFSPERLQKHALILLTTKDAWIDGTDRGIGILSTKINWLEERLSVWESTHRAEV